jgi:hypothetical protein
MRNRAVELHDSEVATIFYFYGAAVVVFSHAYIHESEGSPGRDAGSGWWQRAELVIEEASEIELPEAWSCEICNGSLFLDEVEHSNVFPVSLPTHASSRLKIQVRDANDDYKVVEIVGQKARLTLLGERQYVEKFPGMD